MKRWTCTVIQQGGKYRAIMEVNGKNVPDLPEDVDYRTLIREIRAKTGIQLLQRKNMIFERLSDFEKIATIDNTQTREDCRVTISERINGWKPCWI